MKRIILSLLICGLCSVMMAQGINTTDRVVVSFDEEDSEPIILNQSYGEDDDYPYFLVNLEGSDVSYTGYQMDIHLPDGMSVAFDEENNPRVELADPLGGMDKNYKGTMYPCTATKISTNVYVYNYTHIISSNLLDGKILRVTCYSSQSDNMKDYSGGLFKVYVKASPYMKPGDVDIPIDGVILTQNEWSEQDQQNHAYSYKPTVPCGGTITGVSGVCDDVPFNISAANHWSTCILPFATEIPAGVKAYTSSTSDSENIYLNEAERIEAYTPYILYSEDGYTGTIGGTVNPADYPESGYVTAGNLSGAIVPQTVTAGYVMQKQDGVVQFYAIDEDDSFLVPAGKCWMNIPEAGVKAFNFVVDNGETGIQTTLDVKRNSNVYDLTGRRVSTMKKSGLYIKNGEKYLSK